MTLAQKIILVLVGIGTVIVLLGTTPEVSGPLGGRHVDIGVTVINYAVNLGIVWVPLGILFILFKKEKNDKPLE